ncbi:hypothetical protein Tco_1166490 [Tanacetum coccineum]
MGEIGKQPIGAGGEAWKANGSSYHKLPASRWEIKKRILKELIFGDGKKVTEGRPAKFPPNRWQIKKRLLKELFSTTTSI